MGWTVGAGGRWRADLRAMTCLGACRVSLAARASAFYPTLPTTSSPCLRSRAVCCAFCCNAMRRPFGALPFPAYLLPFCYTFSCLPPLNLLLCTTREEDFLPYLALPPPPCTSAALLRPTLHVACCSHPAVRRRACAEGGEPVFSGTSLSSAGRESASVLPLRRKDAGIAAGTW